MSTKLFFLETLHCPLVGKYKLFERKGKIRIFRFAVGKDKDFLGEYTPMGITHLYRFYLDMRRHNARSKLQFRTKIVSIEEEIREHEATGEL